jgi:hypothetical protein
MYNFLKDSLPMGLESIRASKAARTVARFLADRYAPLAFFLFFVFYISSIHTVVTNFNDFAEYFARAESMHSDLRDYWDYGSDKLLTLIEYFSLFFFRHDFIKAYNLTALMVITTVFAAAISFFYSKNPLFPSREARLTAVFLLLFTPPYFYAATSVEQSVLASACLLLFLSASHHAFRGACAAFLLTLARPEGIFVVAYYPIIIILLRRTAYLKPTLRGYFIFLSALIAYKLTAAWASAAQTQESLMLAAGFRQAFDHVLILKALMHAGKHLILIPLELYKSYIFTLLFIMGILISFARKNHFFGLIFLGHVLLETFAWSAANPDLAVHQASIDRITQYTGFFLKIGNQGLDYHWDGFATTMVRYHYILFPVVAVITAQGILAAAGFLAESLKKIRLGIPVHIVAALCLAPFIPALAAFKTNEIFTRPYIGLPSKDEPEMAMELRKARVRLATPGKLRGGGTTARP